MISQLASKFSVNNILFWAVINWTNHVNAVANVEVRLLVMKEEKS